jgi:hypothetical protein
LSRRATPAAAAMILRNGGTRSRPQRKICTRNCKIRSMRVSILARSCERALQEPILRQSANCRTDARGHGPPQERQVLLRGRFVENLKQGHVS